MANPPPSASKLGLAFKCLGSNVLPQVKAESGPEALEGKRIHAELEKYFNAGRVCSEDATPETRALCENVARAIGQVPSLWEKPELAIYVQALAGVSEFRDTHQSGGGGKILADGNGSKSFDLATVHGRNSVGSEGSVYGGRVAGADNEAESLRARSFVAIADLVQLHSERHASVWDWKSGGWVAEAQWNWQLLLPAIGLWISSDCDADFVCDVGIVYTNIQYEGHQVGPGAYRCTASFLSDRLDQLRGLERRLKSATPENVTLYEGKHCKFCPARDRCPAKIGTLGMAMQMLDMHTADLDLVRMHLAMAESWTSKTAMDALERMGGECNLGDGRIAVLTKQNGKRKLYTRKSNEQKRSDASEASESGAEG